MNLSPPQKATPPPSITQPNPPSPKDLYSATTVQENDWGYAPLIETQHSYLDIPSPCQDSLSMPKSGLERFHRCWYGYMPVDGNTVSRPLVQSWDRVVDIRSTESSAVSLNQPSKSARQLLDHSGRFGAGTVVGDDNSDYEKLVSVRRL